MLDYDEIRTWSETPRMRWRVLGFRPYLRELLWSVARLAIALAIFAMVLSLRTNPFWHWKGLRVILIAAAAGCVLRLLVECIPGSVTFGRPGCSYEGRKKQLRFAWTSCQNVQWTDLSGLKRFEVDVTGKRVRTEHLILPVPLEHAREIDWILGEINKPAPVLPDGPIPLDYVPARFSLYHPLGFLFGAMLVGMSVMLLGVLLWQIATWTFRGVNLIVLQVLVIAGCATSGVVCLRYGLPWFREEMRIGEKMRARNRDAASRKAE
jgi:hypothetical protein